MCSNRCFNIFHPQGDDADATDERKKARQGDERDYDEPDDDEEKQDAALLSDSDDEFDPRKVKLEIDDEYQDQMPKMEAAPSNADIEQLEEIERKEEEEMNEVQGDTDILDNLNKSTTNINSNVAVNDFVCDKEHSRWCTVRFEVPMKFKSIDMTTPLREAAKSAIIWQVPKIKRAFTHKVKDVLVVTTDGINIGVSLNFFTSQNRY